MVAPVLLLQVPHWINPLILLQPLLLRCLVWCRSVLRLREFVVALKLPQVPLLCLSWEFDPSYFSV